MEDNLPGGEEEPQRLGVQRQQYHLLHAGHRQDPGYRGHRHTGGEQGEFPSAITVFTQELK